VRALRRGAQPHRTGGQRGELPGLPVKGSSCSRQPVGGCPRLARPGFLVLRARDRRAVGLEFLGQLEIVLAHQGPAAARGLAVDPLTPARVDGPCTWSGFAGAALPVSSPVEGIVPGTGMTPGAGIVLGASWAPDIHAGRGQFRRPQNKQRIRQHRPGLPGVMVTVGTARSIT